EVTAGTEYAVDITATAEGEVTVEVTADAASDAAGNGNATASDSYVYEIIDGIDQQVTQDVRLFPNPSDGTLNIELPGESTVRILTSTGALILTKDSVTSDVFDISNLEQGVYILQVHNAQGIANFKFIKK
ncbi:MAG: T9SS type A sorting domain-containing protein, partial [Bacteroidales bacterium]|nr:T9SS type A sorting domain-containing protein [Bacteroidales bacterium]